jgi:hypothetical protein
MSGSDDSDFEINSCDVDELIESALSSGSKTPDELLTTVVKKANVSERTYYRHLEKLQKCNVIEKMAEKNDGSQTCWKYILRAPKAPTADSVSSYFLAEPRPFVEEILPSRRYLEIAAWLKQEQDDWPQLEAVRKARIMLNEYAYLIPLIEAPCEDPDQYSYVWSDEPCYGVRYGEFVQSRFFKLKDVYRAIAEVTTVSCDGAVFVGAFESNVVAEQVTLYGNMDKQIQAEHKPMELKIVEEPFSVCIAVYKEVDGGLRVVHVEARTGKIDKAWVKGISKQLCARSQVISSYRSLREDTKRDMLLKFRSVLEKQLLKVPNRYVKLFEELLDHSYKNPSSGYVYALALAIDLATHQR